MTSSRSKLRIDGWEVRAVRGLSGNAEGLGQHPLEVLKRNMAAL